MRGISINLISITILENDFDLQTLPLISEGNSFLRIFWAVRKGVMEQFPGDWYSLGYLWPMFTFSMLKVFIYNQQRIKSIYIVLQHLY